MSSQSQLQCSPCAAGSFMNGTGASACFKWCDCFEALKLTQLVCSPKGRSQGSTGKTVCTRCAPGSYQGALSITADESLVTNSQIRTVSLRACPARFARRPTRPGSRSAISASLARRRASLDKRGNNSQRLQPVESLVLQLHRLRGIDLHGNERQRRLFAMRNVRSTSFTRAHHFNNSNSGTFSNASGLTQCSSCPPGAFSNGHGATVCTACSPGYASSASGQQACSACSGLHAVSAQFVVVVIRLCFASWLLSAEQRRFLLPALPAGQVRQHHGAHGVHELHTGHARERLRVVFVPGLRAWLDRTASWRRSLHVSARVLIDIVHTLRSAQAVCAWLQSVAAGNDELFTLRWCARIIFS